MSAPNPKSTIEAMGWEIEWAWRCSDPLRDPNRDLVDYRASCGNFTTPWRRSLAEVLDDVGKLRSQRNND